MGDGMTFDELKEKAQSLTMQPGVYLMHDAHDNIIYVGKAKHLRNRVSQYFQDAATHSPKTRIMVSKIDHFDVIVAASEFEALVLECSLIKRHMPKYNVLLKDDKGYPYLRLDMKQPYPRVEMVSKVMKDGASYYGPYGSRSVTQAVLEALRSTMRLPDCSRQFPRDIGKGRPCLNYHMNQCEGWCLSDRTQEQYRAVMERVQQLLSGDYKAVSAELHRKMIEASDNLEFELAAGLRDQLNAVESLGRKQLVTAGSLADTDVVGYAETEAKACFVVLHFAGGNLLDKDYEILPMTEERESAVSSLVKQYYLSRGVAPKVICLPFAMEDGELFCELLEHRLGTKPRIKVPQRGDSARLVELAAKNALEEARRVTTYEERISGTLQLLGKMLSITPPRRIESFDISNISGTDIVASMVVFEDGLPKKSQYKRFKVNGLMDQDDYASMRQVVERRFSHFLAGDAGFERKPDLLLIDGGVNHASIVKKLLDSMGLKLSIFGMVKDNRHRTRSLVTPDGQEIAIDKQQSVFSLIGNIQEETHRFAISYHRALRSKRLKYSELDAIAGIGPKRKQELLKVFKSLKAIEEATLPELERVLPKDAAAAVYQHFQNKRNVT